MSELTEEQIEKVVQIGMLIILHKNEQFRPTNPFHSIKLHNQIKNSLAYLDIPSDVFDEYLYNQEISI